MSSKKNKVFFDTDVILDVCFDRKPHVYYSQQILGLAEINEILGCTSALVLANCYYILSHQINEPKAREIVAKLRSFLTILPFTDKEINESLSSDFKDFEEGIQYFICLNNGIKTLVTRNIKDFRVKIINIFTPEQYLKLY
ncbi:MAG: PIN domain-containing protein [Candidatus Margulisiibacteriota bacterium]|jgi:predicted nucleic acid-binding protein